MLRNVRLGVEVGAGFGLLFSAAMLPGVELSARHAPGFLPGAGPGAPFAPLADEACMTGGRSIILAAARAAALAFALAAAAGARGEPGC